MNQRRLKLSTNLYIHCDFAFFFKPDNFYGVYIFHIHAFRSRIITFLKIAFNVQCLPSQFVRAQLFRFRRVSLVLRRRHTSIITTKSYILDYSLLTRLPFLSSPVRVGNDDAQTGVVKDCAFACPTKHVKVLLVSTGVRRSTRRNFVHRIKLKCYRILCPTPWSARVARVHDSIGISKLDYGFNAGTRFILAT